MTALTHYHLILHYRQTPVAKDRVLSKLPGKWIIKLPKNFSLDAVHRPPGLLYAMYQNFVWDEGADSSS